MFAILFVMVFADQNFQQSRGALVQYFLGPRSREILRMSSSDSIMTAIAIQTSLCLLAYLLSEGVSQLSGDL